MAALDGTQAQNAWQCPLSPQVLNCQLPSREVLVSAITYVGMDGASQFTAVSEASSAFACLADLQGWHSRLAWPIGEDEKSTHL